MRSSHKFISLAALLTGSAFLFLSEKSSDDSEYETIMLPAIAEEKPDIASITDINQKKQTFFDYLRPGVAIENARIEKERRRLLSIKLALDEHSLTSEQQATAKRLGKLYSLEPSEVNYEWVNAMLERVDVLPEALVLTQAANESAWGTSRFANEANNYFGQWCYTKGCGLVPLKRSEGMSHEVAKFSSPQQSIHGYFMNVNRNRAYQELRDIRAGVRDRGEDLLSETTALELTNGLLRYSERGEAYVKDLQAMIRHNDKFWTTQ